MNIICRGLHIIVVFVIQNSDRILALTLSEHVHPLTHLNPFNFHHKSMKASQPYAINCLCTPVKGVKAIDEQLSYEETIKCSVAPLSSRAPQKKVCDLPENSVSFVP